MKFNCFLIFTLSLILIPSCNPLINATDDAGFFRGAISYAYTYESDKLDRDSLALAKPHTGLMIFEGNNYKSIFLGKDTLNYIYLGDQNRCYSFSGRGENQDCEDYNQHTDSILSFKIYDTEERIMGQECTILEYHSNYFWNRYYVSKYTKLDPGVYKKHKAYNWSFYGEKSAGGLILKMEHRFKDYTMKGTAIAIENYSGDSHVIEVEQAAHYCNEKFAE